MVGGELDLDSPGSTKGRSLGLSACRVSHERALTSAGVWSLLSASPPAHRPSGWADPAAACLRVRFCSLGAHPSALAPPAPAMSRDS